MPETALRQSCVNCRQVRNCIIAKTLRDYKGHVQTVGLHCSDWEAAIHAF